VRLSSKGEYACLAMLCLARNTDAGPMSAHEIASQNGIPRKFLEQILMTLKRAGYVQSRRGPVGGYFLAKPARDISLAEIIRLMDGPLAPVGSVSEYFRTSSPVERSSALTMVFRDVRNYLADKLEKTTFAELAESEDQATADSAQTTGE
jgi:Rrf2 family transcriptional regulator, cysteine metabolism repressor